MISAKLLNKISPKFTRMMRYESRKTPIDFDFHWDKGEGPEAGFASDIWLGAAAMDCLSVALVYKWPRTIK